MPTQYRRGPNYDGIDGLFPLNIFAVPVMAEGPKNSVVIPFMTRIKSQKMLWAKIEPLQCYVPTFHRFSIAKLSQALTQPSRAEV